MKYVGTLQNARHISFDVETTLADYGRACNWCEANTTAWFLYSLPTLNEPGITYRYGLTSMLPHHQVTARFTFESAQDAMMFKLSHQ